MALWGLCGAATAAAFYARRDSRVVGVALLNPWIKAEETQAKAKVKYYYAGRLRDPEMWRRLRNGEINVTSSVREILETIMKILWGRRRDSTVAEDAGPISSRLAARIEHFQGKTLLILSGNDLTANEFRVGLGADARLRKVMDHGRVERYELMDANHTFASALWRDQVSKWTRDWLWRLAGHGA